MRIIPVIDVMGGQVVRAVGGRRSEYRPIRSRLTDSTVPVEVTRRLLDITGAGELYLADLDAINDPKAGPTPNLADSLLDTFPHIRIWLDAGPIATDYPLWHKTYRTLFGGWRRRSNLSPVIGTESVTSTCAVEMMAAELEPHHAISLDLRDGRWLGGCRDCGLCPDSDPIRVAEVMLGVSSAQRLIILDLAYVGGAGVGTEQLVRRARSRFPNVDLITGGGVRGWDDVRRLEDAGADGVLVASALHDGTLTFPRPAS